VCCDEACTAGCRSCLGAETGGSNGTCGDVTANSDPYDDCGNAAVCEADDCDGAGACELLTGGEACGPAESCTNGQYTGPSTCDVNGQCQTPSPVSCGGHVCNGNVCATSCANHGECLPAYWCDANNDCLADKAQGGSCVDPEECQGNVNCVDGFCCDGPCTGQCVSCAGADTGGADGTCAAISAGTDPDNECPDTGGPCGPDGSGCNGSNNDPHCQGYTCNCDEQYQHGNIWEVCAQNAQECELRVSAQGASCNVICADGGGECVAAYNDQPNGSCGIGANYGCAATGYASIICICSRGCGGDTACEQPYQCTGGDCV
jgi:hypothetical protein